MQKGEVIRQKIIETADALFYQQGFAHTSFSDISDALGMSKGNFYYYFKSKDDILNAVIEKRSQATRQDLAEWDTAPDPRSRLKKYVTMLTTSQDMLEQYGCPVGSICTELSKLHHEKLNSATELFEVYREWLEKQFIQLGYQKKARILSLHLLSQVQGIALITNTYADKSFLQHEATELIKWIDNL